MVDAADLKSENGPESTSSCPTPPDNATLLPPGQGTEAGAVNPQSSASGHPYLVH